MRTYKVNKRVPFSAAHSIKGAGKCANKHGHNWVADIEIFSNRVDDKGFVVDVRDLKNTAFRYDHDDLDKYFDYPSTENVAAKIADDALHLTLTSLNVVGDDPDVHIEVHVHLIETENNSADATAYSWTLS